MIMMVMVQVHGKESIFVVEDDMLFGEIPCKIMRNRDTNESLTFLPSLGGKTQGLRLVDPSTGRLRDVLLTHRNASEVRSNTGWVGAQLIPYANRIRNGTYVLNGKKYYLERNEDRGRFGKIALHGYLYDKQMTISNIYTDDFQASVTMTYDFDGSDEGYPFLLSVELTLTLTSSGLNITTTARNQMTNGQPIPFYNGWHSYFKVSDISKASIEFDPCTAWNHINVTVGFFLFFRFHTTLTLSQTERKQRVFRSDSHGIHRTVDKI